MADSIKISTQALVETAKKIRDCNTKMDQKLTECSKQLNDLNWESDAAKEIRAAMNALKPRFEEYRTVVESYAKYLDQTASGYETTEGSVQSNASEMHR